MPPRSSDRKGDYERMSADREMWVQVYKGEFILYETEGEEPELGNTLRVACCYRGANRRPVTLSLTSLTEEELLALRKFWDRAIEKALPIAQLRDKVADDAFQAGDDTYSRNYREVPNFVVRERPKRQHAEGVHDGPQGVSEVGATGHPPRDSGGVRPELAEPVPANSGTKDDGPTSDLDPGIREVGGLDGSTL